MMTTAGVRTQRGVRGILVLFSFPALQDQRLWTKWILALFTRLDAEETAQWQERENFFVALDIGLWH